MFHRRAMSEHEGHRHRADRWSSAKPAETGGAGVQDIACEHGKQVNRSAEQDGKEVEGHRREQQLSAPDELNAGEQRAKAWRFLALTLGDDMRKLRGKERAGNEEEGIE